MRAAKNGEETAPGYRRICDLADRCLRQPGVTPAWVANPFLHPVSAHPIHLAPYVEETARTTPGADDGRETNRTDPARRVLKTLRRLARASMRPSVPDPAGPFDVILVSWLINERFADDRDDFYFGSLQEEIARRGCRSLLLVGDQTAVAGDDLARCIARNGACARRLIPEALGLVGEARLLAACALARRHMIRRAETLQPAELADFLRAAAHWRHWPLAMLALRMAATVRRLCRRYRPRAVCVLHEGHAWERLVWAGARAGHPGLICSGYQHAVLRRRAHAVRRCLGIGGGYDPDLVFTLGEATAGMLRQAPALDGVRIEVLGTHRLPPSDRQAEAPCRAPGVLVLPEGLDAESRLLFRFAAAAAARMPQVPFVVRAHPIFPAERLQTFLDPGQGLPPNLSFSSQGAIEHDYRRAGHVLYRGSSTAVYAVLHGLRPYYVADPGPDIDPLFQLSAWRAVVTDPAAFAALHAADAAQDDDERRAAWQAAREYVQSYLRPYRPEALDRLCGVAAAGPVD